MEEDFTNFTRPDIETPEFAETGSICKIIAIRHGESIANTQGIFQGQTYDTDLSELGKRQAKVLAERLKEIGVNRIVSSPLKRAYQTAMEISRATGTHIEVNKEIIETKHGVWEGKNKDWIRENYGEVYKMWMDKPSQAIFPLGESFMNTVERVSNFIRVTDFNDRTVIISHDNILRVLMAMSNGDSMDEIWKYEVEPAALNFFEINKTNGKNKLKLLRINDVEHLGNLRADMSNHAL